MQEATQFKNYNRSWHKEQLPYFAHTLYKFRNDAPMHRYAQHTQTKDTQHMYRDMLHDRLRYPPSDNNETKQKV